ncbi:MAG: ABC transporter ATP-binding protein, partial [Rhodoferax sp.]
MTLLSVESVSKSFRGLRAVADASFDVEEGGIVALIGPNGAGKTTIFNVVAGVYAPDSGCIRLGSQRIDGLRPHQVCAAGIGRTFQVVKPFVGLTVLDNVIVGALKREPRVAHARCDALGILERIGLAARSDQPAASLTLPDRKRLEVARALATRPRLLLLDEVMAGMRPTECDRMVEVFQSLNQSGLTILLIEHVMRAVMALAQRVVVLNHG